MTIDMESLRPWIGRVEEMADIASPAPLAGIAALLDHEEPPEGVLPPLWHWLYFLPRARQSLIDRDGHPQRGGFLPPVPLPRRMWAGGDVRFLAPIAVGATLTRRSTIADIKHAQGGSGELIFVTVQHEIFADGTLAVSERQDIVYRGPGGTNPASGPTAPEGDVRESLTADPVRLFRFSALTFNGHRIHYDRNYAVKEEGYGGLVVHGPYVAVLLLDLFRRHHPGVAVTRFGFRGRRPLLDTNPFDLCLSGAELWTRDAEGQVTMSASVEVG
ncbi:FAS1-like dehydratase domain-containing protein [Niveispirillum sp. KHB5.9]|uniref:FAS1-like dehydratase domain-containing protein n=1 Tax=Niveispirillum sp. KHB5.9 TaxID=3400269 RepID=UPI003A8B59A5